MAFDGLDENRDGVLDREEFSRSGVGLLLSRGGDS